MFSRRNCLAVLSLLLPLSSVTVLAAENVRLDDPNGYVVTRQQFDGAADFTGARDVKLWQGSWACTMFDVQGVAIEKFFLQIPKRSEGLNLPQTSDEKEAATGPANVRARLGLSPDYEHGFLRQEYWKKSITKSASPAITLTLKRTRVTRGQLLSPMAKLLLMDENELLRFTKRSIFDQPDHVNYVRLDLKQHQLLIESTGPSMNPKEAYRDKYMLRSKQSLPEDVTRSLVNPSLRAYAYSMCEMPMG